MEKSKINNAVIIIGCPRSGTSLLFRILSTSKHLWSLYRESNDIWKRFYQITGKSFEDEILTDKDLDFKSKDFLLNEFNKSAINNYIIGYITREYLLKRKELTPFSNILVGLNSIYKNLFLNEYRIVEKTPKNCFRISFVNKLFENCKFIFLKRDGRSNINSLMEGWKAKDKYIRGQAKEINLNIKGYSERNGNHWKYVLPPGWQSYTNKPLEEVCAFQWISSNQYALEGLKSIEDKRKYIISYEELSQSTFETIKKITDFIEIPFTKELQKISKDPPLVNYVTKPHKDKWKKNIDLIKNTYPLIEPMMVELGYRLD